MITKQNKKIVAFLVIDTSIYVYVGESGACPPPGVCPPHHVYRTRVPPGEYYFSEDDAPTIRHHFLRHDTHPGVSVFAEVNKTS